MILEGLQKSKCTQLEDKNLNDYESFSISLDEVDEIKEKIGSLANECKKFVTKNAKNYEILRKMNQEYLKLFKNIYKDELPAQRSSSPLENEHALPIIDLIDTYFATEDSLNESFFATKSQFNAS